MRIGRTFLVLMVALLATLTVAGAWAQEGTINVPLAQTWQSDDVAWQAQSRNWTDQNIHNWELGARGKISDQAEAGLKFITLNFSPYSSQGRIGLNQLPSRTNSVDISDWRLLALDIKHQLFGDTEKGLISAVGSFEYSTSPLSVDVGWLQAPPLRFEGQDYVLAFGLPIQWGDWQDKTVWLLEPKVVGMDRKFTCQPGGCIPGFGTITAISGGLIHHLDDQWTFMADATAVLGGDNSHAVDYNEFTREFVWGAGIRWNIPGDKLQVLDVFATNAAGSSTATSVLVMPDCEFGWGARYEMQF